jgi:hypothetical protein
MSKQRSPRFLPLVEDATRCIREASAVDLKQKLIAPLMSPVS